jgi:hypothetical protein
MLMNMINESWLPVDEEENGILARSLLVPGGGESRRCRQRTQPNLAEQHNRQNTDKCHINAPLLGFLVF